MGIETGIYYVKMTTVVGAVEYRDGRWRNVGQGIEFSNLDLTRNTVPPDVYPKLRSAMPPGLGEVIDDDTGTRIVVTPGALLRVVTPAASFYTDREVLVNDSVVLRRQFVPMTEGEVGLRVTRRRSR